MRPPRITLSPEKVASGVVASRGSKPPSGVQNWLIPLFNACAVNICFRVTSSGAVTVPAALEVDRKWFSEMVSRHNWLRHRRPLKRRDRYRGDHTFPDSALIARVRRKLRLRPNPENRRAFRAIKGVEDRRLFPILVPPQLGWGGFRSPQLKAILEFWGVSRSEPFATQAARSIYKRARHTTVILVVVCPAREENYAAQ